MREATDQDSAMAIAAEIDSACRELDDALRVLVASLPPPVFNAQAKLPGFEFAEKSIPVAITLIACKAVSSFHAALILWGYSHLQESWALLRITNECGDDVALLCLPADATSTRLQEDKVREFFHDGVADRPAQGGTTKPPMAKRDSISASVGNRLHAASGVDNPHDAIQAIKRLHEVGSGYVHANYRRTMEMGMSTPEKGFRIHTMGTPFPNQALDLLALIRAMTFSVAATVEMAAAFVGCEPARAAAAATARKVYDGG